MPSVHGSAPKMPISSEQLRELDALSLHLLRDREHVRGRDHDDARPEVHDQLHLLLGLAAGHRDHRAAEPFGAVVRTEPAGEQTIAVCDVDDVARTTARGADRARDEP